MRAIALAHQNRNLSDFGKALSSRVQIRTLVNPTLPFARISQRCNTTTGRVRPLSLALSGSSSKTSREREDWLLWGLHRISVALAFLSDSASSTHANVRPNAIFITPSEEWKLGGFEVLSNPKDNVSIIYTMGGLTPDAMTHAPPEVKKGGWSVLNDELISAADGYALGLLLHTVFNPTQPPLQTANPPHRPVEKGMVSLYISGSSRFVLDGFNLSSESDKASFLRTLKDSASSFPPEFASYRILPCLVSAVEFGGALAATIVPLILQFGKNVALDEYGAIIIAPLVKLFASPDRRTRIALLENLSEFVEKLDKKTVVEKVWPNTCRQGSLIQLL